MHSSSSVGLQGQMSQVCAVGCAAGPRTHCLTAAHDEDVGLATHIWICWETLRNRWEAIVHNSCLLGRRVLMGGVLASGSGNEIVDFSVCF
eukprot:5145148-Alexandrium_andersonii.AAC.1